MKQTVTRTLRAGAKGVKIMVGGRLDGSEIARSEKYHAGRVPLQTLRANIDYGFAEAMTIYGKIGVKVWVYKGDILPTVGNERVREKEKETQVVLFPPKTKFRKHQRRRVRGWPRPAASLNFGEFGLQSLECGHLTINQIEAARKTLAHFFKRGGKIWVRSLATRS